MDSYFAERDVNVGFSGGEKKPEILQMGASSLHVSSTNTRPTLTLCASCSRASNASIGETGCGVSALITHYTRILRYITQPRSRSMTVTAAQGGPELADDFRRERPRQYLSL